MVASVFAIYGMAVVMETRPHRTSLKCVNGENTIFYVELDYSTTFSVCRDGVSPHTSVNCCAGTHQDDCIYIRRSDKFMYFFGMHVGEQLDVARGWGHVVCG